MRSPVPAPSPPPLRPASPDRRPLAADSKLKKVPEYAGGHHEKMDGTGFPLGLTRDQMSIPARIMAIADVFDALMNRRPYKAAMSASQSLAIMAEERGKAFDPELLDCFFLAQFEILRIMDLYADERGAVADLLA